MSDGGSDSKVSLSCLVPINAKKPKWQNWNAWTQFAFETMALVLRGGACARRISA
jgi:hypothetical protein